MPKDDLERYCDGLMFFEVQNKMKFFKYLNEADIKILEKKYYYYYQEIKRRKETLFCDITFENYFLSAIILFISDFKFNNTDNEKIYLYINSILEIFYKMYNIKEKDQKSISEIIKQKRGPYAREKFNIESFLSTPLDPPYTYSWFFSLQIGYYIVQGITELEPNTFTYEQLSQLISLLKINSKEYKEYAGFIFDV